MEMRLPPTSTQANHNLIKKQNLRYPPDPKETRDKFTTTIHGDARTRTSLPQLAKLRSTSKCMLSHLSLFSIFLKGSLMFASSSRKELKNWIWKIIS